ncbi:uncharacterized protein LOC126313351 [Schistocerca gregaria]|uniref:uncharacterized protein LOC126313351 n=1 Tax=Schistocerca gregaria TaxID=7010 RepID=UPI00211E81BD|nr:uncharacterized protein LOC126313351 [Schistocerca gregaria]
MHTLPQDKTARKNKKLKKSFDKTLPAISRLKFLFEYLEKCNEAEAQAAFEINDFEIFSLAHECYNLHEIQCNKGKSNSQLIFQLHLLLKKILTYLKSNVNQRWQVRTIYNILEKSLGIINKRALRLAALENLFLFYQALENPEKDFLTLLVEALNLHVFIPDYIGTHIQLPMHPLIPKTALSARDSSNPTSSKEESVEMLKKVLSFVENQKDSFEFWFKILMERVILFLYPLPCKKLGLLQEDDSSGFIVRCPTELQFEIFRYFLEWLDNPDYRNIMWKNAEPVLMESFRQSCLLPITDQSRYLIHDSIGLFYQILFNSEPNVFVKEIEQERMFYFNTFPLIFKSNSVQKEYRELILDVIKIYQEVVAKKWSEFSEDLRGSILVGLLDLSSYILCSPANAPESHYLCPILVDALLMIWIDVDLPARITWQQLQQCIRSFFYLPSSIIQCKKKAIQLASILVDYTFTFKKHMRIEDKASRLPNNQTSVFPEIQSPIPNERTTPLDSKRKLDWSTAYNIWVNVLNIFCGVSQITDPEIYNNVMHAIVSIAQFFLVMEEHSDWKEGEDTQPVVEEQPHKISIISVFGRWFYESVEKPIEFREGKSLAIYGLCRTILRHSSTELPQELLIHFYDAIYRSMQFMDTHLTQTIIKYTNNVFSLGLPGASILIPSHLSAIISVFSNVQAASEDLINASILILGSISCLPSIFKSMRIPLDQNSPVFLQLQKNDFYFKVNFQDSSFESIEDILIRFLSHIANYQLQQHQLSWIVSIMSTMLWAELSTWRSLSKIKTLVDFIVCSALNRNTYLDALNTIASLSQVYVTINTIDPDLLTDICLKLIENLRKHCENPEFESICVGHVDTLLEWVSIPSVLTSERCIRPLFSVIEKIMKSTNLVSSVASGNETKRRSETNSTESATSADNKAEKPKLKVMVERLALYVTNFSNNWPIDKYYDISESQLVEYPNNFSVFNRYLDETSRSKKSQSLIISRSADITSSSSSECSSTVHSSQDSTGNYVWMFFNQNLFGVCDRYCHKTEEQDPDLASALKFVISSGHGLHFFAAYMEENNMIDLLNLHFELKELKTISKWREASVRERISKLVNRAKDISSAGCPELSKELKRIGENAMPSNQIVWSLLCAFFGKFRASGLWETSKQRFCRLFIRDYSGRYTWDMFPVYLQFGGLVVHKVEEVIDLSDDEGSTWETLKERYSLSVMYNSGHGHDHSKEQSSPATGSNKLQPLTDMDIESLIKMHRKMVSKHQADAETRKLTASHQKQFLEMAEAIRLERKLFDLRKEARLRNAGSQSYAYRPFSPTSTLSTFYASRQIWMMLNMSWTTGFQFHDSLNTRFKRIVKQIDNETHGQDLVKVGLIYVKKQQDQNEILKNDYTSWISAEYKEFSRRLAVVVDLETHRGYTGGLDRSKSVGTTMLYWRSMLNELVFHEVVRMPTVQKDPQQILKKRHVGNDIVHIVWSEHVRDYNTQTITSSFNDAHIIIFPLKNGLFRLGVAKKRNVGSFGPLIHGMVVTKSILPLLARCTAIMANMVVRDKQDSYVSQYLIRRSAFANAYGSPSLPYASTVKMLIY